MISRKILVVGKLLRFPHCVITFLFFIPAEAECSVASSNAASASFASLPKLTGLSAGQEPSDPGVGEGKLCTLWKNKKITLKHL